MRIGSVQRRTPRAVAATALPPPATSQKLTSARNERWQSYRETVDSPKRRHWLRYARDDPGPCPSKLQAPVSAMPVNS